MSDAPVEPDLSAPRKVVCLETYWGDHSERLFQNTSVRPFLEALGSQLYPPLRIAHRFVESAAHLANYTAAPEGLLWRDPDVFDAPVFYLSFHGSPGALRSTLERVEADALCRAFAGWGTKYPNLVYFGACSIFAGPAGRQFAHDFLAASGCRAILGYATDMDWMDSMLTDLLFLRRFFRNDAPWENIAEIHKSVLAEFSPARRLKFRLYQATESA
ncbi:MAG: hypothetical protein EXR27_13525 [Betaproteobacteria bacterium]|nr:hypothetical protein [Betaproteobacteria bacterium]